MKTKNNLIKEFIITALIIIVSLLTVPSQAMVSEEAKPDEQVDILKQSRLESFEAQDLSRLPGGQQQNVSNYVAGELIVKLKEGRSLSDIQSLNKKYRIDSTDNVFKSMPGPQERLKALKNQLAELSSKHESWYWQLNKNSQEYKDYMAKLEKSKESLNSQIKEQEGLIAASQKEEAKIPGAPKPVNLDNIYILKTKGQEAAIPVMVHDYSSNPNVEYAEPNYIMKVQDFPQTLPNDTYVNPALAGIPRDSENWRIRSWNQEYPDMWGLKKIEADKAWAQSQGEGVVVAVIDTGVDYTHPDLRDNIWVNPGEVPNNNIDDDGNGYVDDIYGWNFSENNNDPMDRYGHGTHCAGTIAAVANNAIGVAGVAPRAKIMIVKGLSDTGSGAITILADCVYYATNMGAKVLSNSWGGEGSSQLLVDAFHYANGANTVNKKSVAIVAAGNSDKDAAGFNPANIDTVITVAASTETDTKCSFSNWGEKIDVSAPGGISNILSTMPVNSVLDTPARKVADGYYLLQGTSMACPHVSGVAALVLAKYPNLTIDEVSYALRASSDDIGVSGKDQYFGYGRVNALKAVNLNPQGYKLNITSPLAGQFVRGQVNIEGNVSAPDLAEYKLYYAPKDNPGQMTLITSSRSGAINEQLGRWDTKSCDEKEYLIILKLINDKGGSFTYSQSVKVDNENEPPVILTPRCNIGAVIGNELNFVVNAVDPDDPARPEGRLTYEYLLDSRLPVDVFNLNTRVFSWTPADSDKGIYEVIIKASDNSNIVEKKITITTVYTKDRRLSTHPFWDSRWCKRIYGDKIVWNDGYEMAGKIYMYDLSQNQEKEITQGATGYGNPAIYGNKIVWLDSRDNKKDIYLYDLSTGQERRLTNGLYVDYAIWPVDIYEDKVVFSAKKDQSAFPDIYLYNITNGSINKLNNISQATYSPRIYGDKIVWYGTFDNAGTADIAMYDLTNQQEKRLTANNSITWPGEISENIAVWKLLNNVYIYDIQTEKVTQVFTYEGNAPGDIPETYADMVVYSRPWEGLHLYNFSADSDTKLISHIYGTVCYGPGACDCPWFQTVYPNIFKNKIITEVPRDCGREGYLLQVDFYFFPYITSILPLSANIGSQITITGGNFGYSKDEGCSVKFPGEILATEFQEWTDKKIVCTVPAGAQPGPIKVITPGGTAVLSSGRPQVFTKNILVYKNIAKEIVLSGSSNNGDNLTFTATAPAHGALSAQSGSLLNGVAVITYTPDDNYAGPDLFSYKVNDGVSDSDEAVVAISVDERPAAPSNLSLNAQSSAHAQVRWVDNSGNEYEFKIERSTDGVNYKQISMVSAGSALYDDTSLTAGNTYYYRVCASNIFGDSEYSNVKAIKMPLAPVLSAVLNSQDAGKVDLNWSNLEGATAYQLIRSGAYIGSSTVFASNFTDVPPSPGVYRYKVRIIGLDPVGGCAYESNFSREVSITVTVPSANQPAAPSNLRVTSVGTSNPSYLEINFAWDDNSNDETNFELGISQNGTSFQNIRSFSPNTTATNLLSVYMGKPYYAIRALKTGASASGWSNVVDVREVFPKFTLDTANITATIGQAFTKDLSTYLLPRAGSNPSFAVTLGSLPTGLSINGINLEGTPLQNSAGSHTISITATNSMGKTLTPLILTVNVVPAPANQPPAAIFGLYQDNCSIDSIKLGWMDYANNETGFKLERSTDNINFTKIAEPTAAAGTATQVFYEDRNLDEGSYYYRVCATNSAGDSVYNTFGPAATRPKAPTGLTATALSSNQIELTWVNNSNNTIASNFWIERKTDTESWAGVATLMLPTPNTYTDSGLQANTNYTYRVTLENRVMPTFDSTPSNEASAMIVPANQPPQANAQTLAAAKGAPLVITLTGSDIDGTIASYGIVAGQGPNKGSLSGLDTTTGVVTYTVNNGVISNDIDSFKFTVTDDKGTVSPEATVSINITVPAPVNHAPVIDNIVTNPADGSVVAGEPISITIIAHDSDQGDALTFSSNLPSTATFDQQTKTFTWIPDIKNIGSAGYMFIVADSGGLEDRETVNINVTQTKSDQPLDPPGLTAATVSNGNQIGLSWINNSNLTAGNVHIERKTGTGSWDWEVSLNLTDTTYNDVGLQYNTEYTYRMQFMDEDGVGGAYSREVSATTGTANQSPAKPTIRINDLTPTSVHLVWNRVVDPDGDTVTYDVYDNGVFDMNTGDYVNIAYNNLLPDHDYTYQVEAVDSKGAKSGRATFPVHTLVAPTENQPPNIQFITTDPANIPVNEGQLLTVNVVATDPNPGDILSYSAALEGGGNLPQGFSTQGTSAGYFSWTPSLGQAGAYRIIFTVNDNHGKSVSSSPQIITVNAAPAANQPPIANTQTLPATKGVPLAITLTGSDTDGTIASYNIAVGQGPNKGTLSGTAPSLVYTVGDNAVNGDVDSFKFTVTDDQGAISPEATVSINITVPAPVNHTPPTPLNLSYRNLTSNSVVIYWVRSVDPDGDTVTYNLYRDGVLQASGFTQTGGTDNDLTADTDYIYGVEAVDGRDTSLISDRATLTIHTPAAPAANQPPQATAQILAATKGTPLAITLTGSDADGTVASYSIVAGQGPDRGKGTLSGTAPRLVYTVGDNAVNGDVDSFKFTVTDDQGAISPEATVSINITVPAPVNHAPVLNPIGNKVIDENKILGFTVSAQDLDDGDVASYSVDGLPQGAIFNPSTGVFNWAPGYDQEGNYEVTFKAIDAKDTTLKTSEKITITVNNVPRYPSFPSGATSVTLDNQAEGTNINQTLPQPAVSAVTGDRITYIVVSKPDFISVDSNNGTITGTIPYIGDDRTETVVVKAHGSEGDSTNQFTLTINIKNVNRAPVITPIADKTISEGQPLEFDIEVKDADNEIVVIELSNVPSGATLADKTFRWMPSYNQSGKYILTLTATDAKGAVVSQDFSITVNDAVEPPKPAEPPAAEPAPAPSPEPAAPSTPSPAEPAPVTKEEPKEEEAKKSSSTTTTSSGSSFLIVQQPTSTTSSTQGQELASSGISTTSVVSSYPAASLESVMQPETNNMERAARISRDEAMSSAVSGTPASAIQPASMNFMASHDKKGAINEISVLDAEGEVTHTYEVKRKKTTIILSRDDGSQISLQLKKDKKSISKMDIKETEGVSKQDIEKELKGILSLMGLRRGK